MEKFLHTEIGKELMTNFEKFSQKDVENLNVGTKLVHFGHTISRIGAFQIEQFDPIKFRKITSSGKVSQAKNAIVHGSFYPREFYKYFEGATKIINDFMDRKPKTRDFQKQKIYDSERIAVDEMNDIQYFDTIEEGNTFIKNLLQSKQFKKCFPDFDCVVSCEINDRMRGKAWANYGCSTIEIAPDSKSWALTDWLLCHELAHFTALRDQHREKFASNYLKILQILDKRKANILESKFIINGVKFEDWREVEERIQ